MDDYETLDLTRWCNAGIDMLIDDDAARRAAKSATQLWLERGVAAAKDAGPAMPPIGKQSFHGLPFLIGAKDSGGNAPCFVAFDTEAAPLSLPIGRLATRVIFAHRLRDTDLHDDGVLIESGTPAKLVAEYVFRLVDGREEIVPVREQFEIAAPRMLGKPYSAITDQKDLLHPRYEGRWELTGRRQVEVIYGMPRAYYLWAWANPEPAKVIERVEIIPKGPRFLIAGITLSHLDEHPFVRQGRREVRAELTDPEAAAKLVDLEVRVDRGVATYAQPLPQATADEFLSSPWRGWGQAPNSGSSPSFFEVAAIPSATVSIQQDGVDIGHFRWGELEQRGKVVIPAMRVELIDRGRNWVHVSILDEETGRPVPCRVHFRSPEGVPYQPHGHPNYINSNLDTFHIDVGGDLRLGQVTYAYIDGTCQGWLPRGEVLVDIARGFEYEPLRTKVTITPGQRELTLVIKRWIDMNSRRWFSGDSHVHFLSAQGAHLESQGEDLDVVNLLQSQWGHMFANTEDFTGRPSVSQDGSNIVYVSQENRQHMLGHAILLGLKTPVMPWCTDGPNEAELGGFMESTLSHWADECHKQGGTVILPHFPIPNGEPAALIVTGRVEGVEMTRHAASAHLEYYRYLNCGYRLPLLGGTDKMTSDVPVGLYRTYVHVPADEVFNYENWCRNVARGRTFISGGPIIGLKVDGHDIGDTIYMAKPGTAEVEAWAESIFPVHSLQIVQHGRVVASTEENNGARRLELRTKINVDGHTWVSARCGGPAYHDCLPHWDSWGRGIIAHTSPIYVACGGEWSLFEAATAHYMLTLIEGSLAYVRNVSGQRRPESITHHHGELDHQAFLERPFLEARAAIQRRMAH
jgi:hypothetical protein